MGVHQTKTFMSGNSVAVRLPRAVGFGPDQRVLIEQDESGVHIRLADDPEQVRRELHDLAERLRAIGPPPDGVQDRDPFEFPERLGL